MTILHHFVYLTTHGPRSCINCVYAKSWYCPSNYHEPADYGWECSLHLDEYIKDPEQLLDFDQMGEYYASRCSHYQKAQPSRDIAPDEF